MNRRYPLTVESGEGCWLKTTDGQKYLDCVSGIATCALGHSNAELNAAVTKQMQTMHHVSNLYFIPAQAALANWLCENSGADKVFFCNSGAEANEAAIKVARRHASNRGITVSTTKASLFFYASEYLMVINISSPPPPRRNRSLSVPSRPFMAAPWRP